jgi:hypothetical protein
MRHFVIMLLQEDGDIYVPEMKLQVTCATTCKTAEYLVKDALCFDVDHGFIIIGNMDGSIKCLEFDASYS